MMSHLLGFMDQIGMQSGIVNEGSCHC